MQIRYSMDAFPFGMRNIQFKEYHANFDLQKMQVAVFLIFLTLLHLRSAIFVVIRRCNANTDCKEDECCLQKPWTSKFFCAKRVREGKVCWSKQHNATVNWDKYRVICPCVHKHECKFQDPIFVLKPVLAAATCQPKMEDMMK